MKRSIIARVACFMVVACGGVDAEYVESESELGTNQAAMTQWAPLIPSAPSGGSLCGNGKLDFGEACDGYRFGGETCVTLGYDAGSLKCRGCTIDASGCYEAPQSPTECGNGVAESGEQCDGPISASCEAYGYDSGVLGCSYCKYDFSACQRTAPATPSGSLCGAQVQAPVCSDVSCKNCCRSSYPTDEARLNFCQALCAFSAHACKQAEATIKITS